MASRTALSSLAAACDRASFPLSLSTTSMSSSVKKRKGAKGPSSGSEASLQEGKDAPQSVPPTPVRSNRSTLRLVLRVFFGLVSAVCFSITALRLLRQQGYAPASIMEESVVAQYADMAKSKAAPHRFQSAIPFPLDVKSPASDIIRTADIDKQAAVREAFQDSWNAYVEDAFGADEYHPISQTGTNFSSDGGVGYFIVDTLDVLLIMGEEEGYSRARDWVQKVDWGSRSGKFSVFETTIRTLGGLLSAHALCQPGDDTLSPQTSRLCSPGDAIMFLEKAVSLAEKLKPAFEYGKLGIPMREVDFQTGQAFPDVDNRGLSSLAEVASIQLEFKYLAHATGDESWWTLAEKPMRAIRKAAVKTRSEGLLPIFISPEDGELYLSSIRLGSRGDSYYEYLIKQYVQTNHSESIYANMYEEAMTGIKRRLLRQSLERKLLYTSEIEPRMNPNTASRTPVFYTIPKQDHLVCFLGGSYMLGAAHTNNEQRHESSQGKDHGYTTDTIPPLSSPQQLSPLAQEDLTVGHELIRTCVDTYTGTSTGLSAEITMFRMQNDSYPGTETDWYIKKRTKEQRKYGNEPLIDARNILRPETVESLFIAFHLTGDDIYRQWGWQIFESFVKATKIRPEEKGRTGAFSSIRDVEARAGHIDREDRMETFWLAETLKYLYLLFSDQDTLRLDQWVLNTEAHPLPIFQPVFDTTVYF